MAKNIGLSKKQIILWLTIFFGIFLWSAIKTQGYFIWFLEVAVLYRCFDLSGHQRLL